MELQAGVLDLVYLDLEAIEGISESACQYVAVYQFLLSWQIINARSSDSIICEFHNAII